MHFLTNFFVVNINFYWTTSPATCFIFPFLLRERDTDKDGKLSFKEFFHGLFDLVRNYEEEPHNSSHESNDSQDAPARKLFADLDKDADGYLA